MHSTTALTPLKTLESFSARSATASDASKFTASATIAAAQGSYDVQVESLATAHQLTSDPFVSGAAQVVGTGTLTIGSGDDSFPGQHRRHPQHAGADPRRDQPGHRQRRPGARHDRQRRRRRAPGAVSRRHRRRHRDHRGAGRRRRRPFAPRIQPVAHHQLHAAARSRGLGGVHRRASSIAAPPTRSPTPSTA